MAVQHDDLEETRQNASQFVKLHPHDRVEAEDGFIQKHNAFYCLLSK